jgi:hypothetical protein
LAACQSEQGGVPTFVPSATPTITPLPTRTPTPPPVATATLLPSVTANPTEIGLTPEVRLFEDFSAEVTCLQALDHEQAIGGVQGGAYRLEVIAADATVMSNCETLVAGDLVLEVDARMLEAAPGATYYYGLLFRVSGDERYAFVVGSEGGYCAYYASSQAIVPLTNSTDFATSCWALPPEALNTAGTNHLRVVAVADRMDFYLNGALLAIVRDRKLTEGLVGFVVATFGDGDVTVAFDNLLVGRP